ncbi:hypothetical protein B0H13DRAFT_1586961 [Mycena leptocephala]|nr:hypothetical protein B0H13DRAFT_1586961 [Mycena leptocephala]
MRSVSPVGLVWDSTNYSCGYDAFFTSLACLWRKDPDVWTHRLAECSPLLGLWATTMNQNILVPEEARNTVRRVLHLRNAADFPMGPRYIKLDALLAAVTDVRSYGSTVTSCDECGYRLPGFIQTFGQYINVWNTNALRRKYPNGLTLLQWFQHQFDCQVDRCPQCTWNGMERKMRRLTTVHAIPSLMIIGINFNTLLLSEEIKFGPATLKLRGLIYHSPMEHHFTSVIVDAEGIMWYHDGITTRRTCINNGRFADVADPLTLHRRHDQRLSAAIYALQ